MEVGHNEGSVVFVQVVSHNQPRAVPGRPTWLLGTSETRLPVVRPRAPRVIVAAQLEDLSLPHRPPLAPADQEEDDQEEEGEDIDVGSDVEEKEKSKEKPKPKLAEEEEDLLDKKRVALMEF